MKAHNYLSIVYGQPIAVIFTLIDLVLCGLKKNGKTVS